MDIIYIRPNSKYISYFYPVTDILGQYTPLSICPIHFSCILNVGLLGYNHWFQKYISNHPFMPFESSYFLISLLEGRCWRLLLVTIAHCQIRLILCSHYMHLGDSMCQYQDSANECLEFTIRKYIYIIQLYVTNPSFLFLFICLLHHSD